MTMGFSARRPLPPLATPSLPVWFPSLAARIYGYAALSKLADMRWDLLRYWLPSYRAISFIDAM
jgi:hypothetical protein